MQAFHYWQKRNFGHQEKSEGEGAGGEFAKWQLRILGKAFPYHSTYRQGRSSGCIVQHDQRWILWL